MSTGHAILLATGSLAALLCLFEVVARWWLRTRSGYYVFPPGLRMHMDVDLEQAPVGAALARFEINRDGERGPEAPRDQQGLYRVLTCGGSAAEGFLLDEPSSWAGALRGLLENPKTLDLLGAQRAHVGSIGRSRTGAEAVDLIFDKTFVRYPRLQAIVIMVGASDLVDWIEAGAPDPWTAPTVRAEDIFAEHPHCELGWGPRKWALYVLLRRWLRRVLRPVHLRTEAGKSLARVRAMRANAKVMREDVPDPARMLDHFGRHLRTLLRKARAHADTVLVLGQPCFDRNLSDEARSRFWDFCVGNAYQEEVTTYFSTEASGELMRLTRERAGEIAREEGAEYVDLGEEIEPALDVYYDFLHFTPKGAAMVAAAIERVLLAHAIRNRVQDHHIR